MRGELGAFVLADALAAFRTELADQPPKPRTGDQPDTDERCADGDRAVAGLCQCIVRGEERRDAEDDKTDTTEDHQQWPPSAEARAHALGVARPLLALCLGCSRPDQQRADARDRQWEQAVAADGDAE